MVTIRFCANVRRRHFDVVRGTILGLQVRGEKIQAHEGRGWLSRRFWIEGTPPAAMKLQCLLRRIGAVPE